LINYQTWALLDLLPDTRLLVEYAGLLFIYVDDILLISKTKQAYERFRDLFKIEYMIQPESFDYGSGRVCLFQRCIYGLKQSGRRWYCLLSNFLKSIGFEIWTKETCLLFQAEVLLFIYVDEVMGMSKRKQAFERFRELLKSEFKIRQLENPNTCSMSVGVSEEWNFTLPTPLY